MFSVLKWMFSQFLPISFLLYSQEHGWNATTPSYAWSLFGCMQPFGPLCPWLAGGIMPQSHLGPPALWTGGLHKPLFPVRALSWRCYFSVLFSQLESLFSPMSWSSSRSSLPLRKFHIMMPASETTTTLKWNWQRWVRFWREVGNMGK